MVRSRDSQKMQACRRRPHAIDSSQALQNVLGLERHHSAERDVVISHALQFVHAVRVRPWTPALCYANWFESDTTLATFRFELRRKVECYGLTLELITRRCWSVIPAAVVGEDYV